MREVVTYLETELGMSQDEVRSMVEEFPEVLGLSVEGRMKANVAQLESQWKMSIPGACWRGSAGMQWVVSLGRRAVGHEGWLCIG